MKLGELRPAAEKVARKRVGRGIGSGTGKTSGKGHKGQKARSGGGVRRGFEGGQTPLYRRLPKRGFSNSDFKIRYATINVSDLNEKFKDGDVVTCGQRMATVHGDIRVLLCLTCGIECLGHIPERVCHMVHRRTEIAQCL